MKITILILALAAVAFVSATKTKQEVLSFWTQEKIAQATPLRMPIVDSVSAKGANNEPQPTGGNTREVPANLRQEYPFATAGKLVFNTGTRLASCTAVSIGNNIVLTAGHCVHDGSRNYFTDIVFMPQFRDGTTPKGKFAAHTIYALPGWQRGGGRAFSRDVGYLIVENNENEESLESAVGKVTPVFNLPRRNPTISIGYPGNIGNAQKMIMSEGVQSNGHIYMRPMTTRVPSRKTFGASGGPWIINGKETNGVNGYIVNQRNSRFLYGPYFDSVVETMVEEAYEIADRLSCHAK